jgi:hypothetical protein
VTPISFASLRIRPMVLTFDDPLVERAWPMFLPPD